MTNVYHGVQNVVVRVSGAGGRPRGRRRTAILLNCHFDTVPDSPGASDDGAGCAVLLEVMRALAATPHPLRHDVIFLLNGAEENILQASHGFITQHKWAKSVRAFINIEACGAGGREVLFQAGPDDPWIMEVYAAAVPHPFASSLAQELFQSGLIPADTDFRIFRDFGKLSGVDLAWSSNGYVYHTGLDTADNIPKSALQRTGDNVLALTRGMLSSENLEKEVDKSGQLVYFDVLGAVVISGRAPLAALAVLATIALLLLKIHVNATRAKKALYTRRGWWWRGVGRAAAAQCAAACGGVAASCAVAAALCVLRRRLAFYSRAWLLAPLYALPALAVSWWVLLRLQPREGALVRGWWRGRLQHDAGAALWGALLLLCAACGLRSAFLPLLWTLLPTLADLVPLGAPVPRWWCGSAVCVLQSCYLSVGSLRMFVPVLARAGARALPADMAAAALVAALSLGAGGWLLPLAVSARRPHRLIRGMLAGAALCVLAVWGGAAPPYSAARPQRVMLFHTRRWEHVGARVQELPPVYWLPDLDDNSPSSLLQYVPEFRGASPVGECGGRLYCGAPYYLPVLSLIPASHRLPAPAPPRPAARADVTAAALDATTHAVSLNVTGPCSRLRLRIQQPRHYGSSRSINDAFRSRAHSDNSVPGRGGPDILDQRGPRAAGVHPLGLAAHVLHSAAPRAGAGALAPPAAHPAQLQDPSFALAGPVHSGPQYVRGSEATPGSRKIVEVLTTLGGRHRLGGRLTFVHGVVAV
nr:endoplasmic reticulum metallopeptidase 1 isoform X5 [Bombyx mori]